MSIVGKKECVKALTEKLSMSGKEAEKVLDAVVEVIIEKCVENDGVSFKGLFTLKKAVRKGRKGVCSFNGEEWETEDRNTLKVTVGKELDKMLNE